MTGLSGLANMDPLTAAESLLVAGQMALIRRTIRERRWVWFVSVMGREKFTDAAVVAYMRAAKCWKPELAPFEVYARIWVRKYLIETVIEATKSGEVEVPPGLACGRLSPDQQAENADLVAAAFRVLPKRQREVLMLRSAGLTWPEVAKSMGCCLNLVRRYHVRAMTRIWRFVPQIRGD